MKKLLIALMLLPAITDAQITNAVLKENSETGIKWTTGLSWEQIKQKAKAENKHIFLDIMTTWCPPCKEMDKNVFVNDSVGDYFNEKFIAVKVQMDKTDNDNEEIKKWYGDAEIISKQFDIQAFPSLLFLNPKGIIVDLKTGYKNAEELIHIAQASTDPGRVYISKRDLFNSFVAEYKKGNINYKEMPAMIKLGQSLKFDTAFIGSLQRQFGDYLSGLDESQRYTKENIEYWNMYAHRSSSKTFGYFYKDGKQIDKVMGLKGYATAVVDKTIYYELVVPFFKEQNTNAGIPMTGMYLSGPGVKTDSSEADWKKLEKAIRKKFNMGIAKRNVVAAKVEWYLRHWNYVPYSKYSLVLFEKYTPDIKAKGASINAAAWEAFLRINDKSILNGYVKLMHEVINFYPTAGQCIDTYANLLYKLGRREEAIKWEEKATALKGIGFEEYILTVEKMKKGESNYNVTPLVDYKNSNRK